jgi:class 3 adenylate cyclase/YHS domain-containing protein
MRSREPSAFVFADLAGYAALTEAHGDDYAADLAAHFYDHARSLLERCGGEEVKVIGDEMMARIGDPAAAIEFAVDLGHRSMRRHEHLAVRVGVHYGRAVRRGGDWFGASVNIASRAAALAEPGEVLTTRDTAQAAGGIEGVSYRSRGKVKLKHVRRPVELIEVLGDEESAGLLRDPVCHMLLDPTRTTIRLEHRGAEYRFCSATCRAAFEAEPELYI